MLCCGAHKDSTGAKVVIFLQIYKKGDIIFYYRRVSYTEDAHRKGCASSVLL